MKVHSMNGMKMKLKKGSNSSIRFKVERIKPRKKFKQKRPRSCGIQRSSSTTSSSESFSSSIPSDSSCSTSASTRSVCHFRKIRKLTHSNVSGHNQVLKNSKVDKSLKKNNNLEPSHIQTSLDKPLGTIDSASHKSNIQMVTCPRCDHVMQKKNFNQHFMKFHIGNKASSSLTIRRSNSSSSTFKPHTKSIASTSSNGRKYVINQNNQIQCSICEKVYSRKDSFDQHYLRSHTDSETWKHQCDKCGKRFPNRHNLTQHLRTKIYQQGKCQLTKLSTTNVLIQPSTTRAQCPHCDKNLDYKYLDDHVTMKHTDPSKWKFSCHICDKMFPVWNYLRSHFVSFHKVTNDKEVLTKIKDSIANGVQPVIDNRTQTALVECPQCGQFLQQNNLRRHNEKQHRDSNGKTGKSLAKESGTTFYPRMKMDNHSKSSLAPSSSTMTISSNVNAKLGDIRKRSERVKCHHCDKILRFGNLVRHTMSKHSDPQNWKFVCPTCNKRYPISGYLKNHMKSHVKEECSSDDPFLRIARKSNTFTKLASTSANLWTHKCELCNRLFTTKEYLEQHIETWGHKKTPRMVNDTGDESICKPNLNIMEVTLSSSSSDDDDELNQQQFNESIISPEWTPEFTCTACPIIPAFASSIELIDHLQTFHVHSQTTPPHSPVQPVEVSSETAFLLPTSNNVRDSTAHLNSSFHSSFSNVNNQNNGRKLVSLTVTYDGDQPSQATNLDLLIDPEPVMINKDPILSQYVSEMMSGQEDLFN